MASDNRRKTPPQTSQVKSAPVQDSEEVGSTSTNNINTKYRKEVMVKLDNNKTLHIVHLDPKTVSINGRPFKRELVNYYLNIHKQQQQERKQQVNAKIRDLLKRKIKQESKTTNNSTPIVNGNDSSSSSGSVKNSLLRTQLLTPKTTNKKSQPPENNEEDPLFNKNHSNSDGIKFLQHQFKTDPTLQSILAEIATLQKEYNDLDANLIDKEVEAMREKNRLPSMVDFNLFKGQEPSKTNVVKGKQPETVVRPSTSQTPKSPKPVPELIPVNGLKQVVSTISNHNDTYGPGKLVIDEDAIYEQESSTDSIKPERTKKPNSPCLCYTKRKTKSQFKRHSIICNTFPNIMKIEKSLPNEPVSPSSSSASSDLKIMEVFANGKKIISCDRCNFEGTEDEVANHSLSHFKKVKETHKNNLYSKSEKHLCGGNVQIKSEPIDCIVIDDDD
ncbi:unnamed protein product [Ceutorhynchus assimilis]|uniref:Uncharacterized protein n=1 Tax=Ceutorhynchus assimilis TaxID=467358 RepID=A0A9N9MCL9_9CUCU|nr:unnamed protein product [Ceutorhynchus assimilis]